MSIIFKILSILISFFYKGTILSGTFKGNRINKNKIGSSLLPKLIGSYESEISEQIKLEFINSEYFIDFGCAGGYYIKLALNINDNLKIYGYDSNSKAVIFLKKYFDKNQNIFICNEMINKNSMTNIFAKFQNTSKIFLLIDIEGYEWCILESLKELLIKFRNLNCIIELHNHDYRASGNQLKYFFDHYDCVEVPYRFRNKNMSLKEKIFENEFRDINTSYLQILR